MKKISLFDLDNTLLKTNSSYCFGSYLYKRKAFPFSAMLYSLGCYSLHKLGPVSLHQLHQSLFKTLFLGRQAALYRAWASAFAEDMFDSLCYAPACERLKAAQQDGHFTQILSSSPDFLVDCFARQFGVDSWAATCYTVDPEDRFHAITDLMEGQRKANHLLSLCQELGVSRNEVVAYSDSYLDLAFLDAAGVAIGVNPDKRLRALCKKKCWEII